MEDIIYIVMREASLSRPVMDHIIQLSYWSSEMSELSSKYRFVLHQGLRSVSLEVANTIVPLDGDTLFMQLLEPEVGDGTMTN